MHERDRNRTFTDARRHPLYGAVSNIADHKDAGNVRFQQTRIAIELPTVGPLAIARELRAGIDKAAFITFDDVREPVCVWRCSDQDEQRVGWHFVCLVRL